MATFDHGSDGVLELGADHGREQPGADDVVGLGPEVHREDPAEEVRVVLPSGGDLRGERGGGPGVHDVGVPDEASRLPALVLAVALGHVGRRIDRQAALVGEDRRCRSRPRRSRRPGTRPETGHRRTAGG